MAIPQNITSALLAGGVNLQFGWYDARNYQPHSFDAELPLVVAAGAKHVRLPISMDTIENGTTGKVRTDRYADLVAFLTLAKSYGLVVIADVHNTGMSEPGTTDWSDNYMWGLATASIRTRHISLLSDLAARLEKDADLNYTILQPANEPIYVWGDEKVWYDHQAKLLPAMRAAAPNLVFFAMAHDWQGIEATLWSLRTPPAISNIIIDCHFYEPMNITHPKDADGPSVKYPATYTTWRGSELWNKARIEALFTELVKWRNQHNAFVHFSEIGTKTVVPEDVRAAYLGDLVSILRSNNFGYSIYDWHTAKPHNFGVKMHPKVVSAVLTKTTTTPPTDPPPVDPPPVNTGIDEALLRQVVTEVVRAELVPVLAKVLDAAAVRAIVTEVVLAAFRRAATE